MNTEAEGRIADETCAKQLLRKLRNHTEAHRHYYGKKECPICEMNKVVDNYLSRPEPQAVSGETPCNHELWERETACADGYCPICLARRLREAEERGSKFQAAIEWALGQGDSDFEPRRPNDPPYYWRTKLRKLAFGSLTYNKETRTISTEAAERRPSVREAQEEVREACARLIEDFKTGGSDAETVTYWGKTLAEVIRSLDLSKVGGAR